MQTRKSCGFVPFIQIGNEIKFLFIHQQTSGRRSFPKGGIEQGETQLECAHREMEEETGLTDFEVYPDIKFETQWITTKDGQPLNRELTLFLAKLPKDFEKHIVLEAGKIISYKICTYDELLLLNDYAAFKVFVQQLKDKMNSFINI